MTAYDPTAWWTDTAIPVWDRYPIARHRKRRKETFWITCHRIKYGEGAQGVLDFFWTNPDGVATVTIPGSYKAKLPTIKKWRKEGIPPEFQNRSFCGYHVLVDPEGWIYNSLPLDRVGAHDPYTNAKGIGVAFIGDFRTESELAVWEKRLRKGGDHLTKKQKEKGRALFKNLLLMFPEAKITTHDISRQMHGLDRKPCPGSLAEPEILEMAKWAKLTTEQMAMGRRRH